MKKHSKLFFIISFIAQFASYIGAAFMFFKKNKPVACLFAAIGLLATIFGLAALDINSEGNKHSSLRVKTPVKEKTEDFSGNFEIIDTEAEEKALFDSIEFDANDFDSVAFDTDNSEQSEMEQLEAAVDILKRTTASGADADIESELLD